MSADRAEGQIRKRDTAREGGGGGNGRESEERKTMRKTREIK